VLTNSTCQFCLQLAASIGGFERNWWSNCHCHECHLESFLVCLVHHRRQLHNRRCMWQKSGGGRLRSRKALEFEKCGDSSLAALQKFTPMPRPRQITTPVHHLLVSRCRNKLKSILLQCIASFCSPERATPGPNTYADATANTDPKSLNLTLTITLTLTLNLKVTLLNLNPRL